MNQTINTSTQEQAADAVAAAIAEGMDPEAVGEAISLAAKLTVGGRRCGWGRCCQDPFDGGSPGFGSSLQGRSALAL